MAENAPPEEKRGNVGMPYYERLRRDLRESLQKKRVIDSNLARIEDEIQRIETSYLEETSAGNIIKGFDNYIKGASASSNAGGAGAAGRKKTAISDADRIFSRSSSSFLREASTPGSADRTPSQAATPTSSFPTRESSQAANGANKNGQASKKKKAADDDDTDSKPAKRGKITYGPRD